MIKSYIKFSGVTLFLLVLVLIPILCRNGYYRTFVFPGNDPYFSFEYPSNYEIAYNEQRNETDTIGYLYFFISRSAIDNERIDLYFYFEIEVFPVIKNITEIILEERQAIHEAIDYFNYQMIRDDSIVVSGVEAQHISCSYDYTVENIEYTRIHEELISGYNQVMWIIRADYDQNLAEEKSAEFQHLIDTLNIIKDF